MNSVSSTFLAHMSDEEIRRETDARRPAFLKRMFPGSRVEAADLATALNIAGADFTVEKHPLLVVNSEAPNALSDPSTPISEYDGEVATVRVDIDPEGVRKFTTLKAVGPDYGVVQTSHAMEALDILAKRGDVEILNVEQINDGARVRVTALLGTTTFPSLEGAPNTLGHFGVFEATHDGSACTTCTVFTVRIECFNGMTSRKVVKVHKLRHTSKVGERLDDYSHSILTTLIGECEAEAALFNTMVNRAMALDEFETLAKEWLGGLADDATPKKRTMFENNVQELTEYFEGGNEGAGATAWGGYNSFTRFVQAIPERVEDAKKRAGKFASNLEGVGQKRIQKALALCTR